MPRAYGTGVLATSNRLGNGLAWRVGPCLGRMLQDRCGIPDLQTSAFCQRGPILARIDAARHDSIHIIPV